MWILSKAEGVQTKQWEGEREAAEEGETQKTRQRERLREAVYVSKITNSVYNAVVKRLTWRKGVRRRKNIPKPTQHWIKERQVEEWKWKRKDKVWEISCQWQDAAGGSVLDWTRSRWHYDSSSHWKCELILYSMDPCLSLSDLLICAAKAILLLNIKEKKLRKDLCLSVWITHARTPTRTHTRTLQPLRWWPVMLSFHSKWMGPDHW